MKRFTRALLAVLVFGCCLAVNAQQQDAKLDTARIEQLTGAKGAMDAKENVFKVTMPRPELATVVAGVKLSPPTGLSCWAAFTPAKGGFMVMGDVVLTEGQVNPVMDVALAEGLDVTAIHNHFMWDSPRIMYMHLGGMGEQEKLASAVGKVFAKIKETGNLPSAPPKSSIDAAGSVKAAELEQIMGAKAQVAGGAAKFIVGKTTSMHGQQVGNAMGVNTWAAFVGGDEQAAVDGDFVMYDKEVQGVLKALRKGGVNIVALHNHMIGEEPRVFFLHFWGVGKPADLARTIRSALDITAPK